jgi:excisionase family DNA binding protein
VVDICYTLSKNVSVEFTPHHTVLTTQEAADILNISRPTLVRLLDEGEIPHFKRGRHRRVQLIDVLAYEEREQRARGEALDRMVHEAEEAGLYDDDVFTTPKATR